MPNSSYINLILRQVQEIITYLLFINIKRPYMKKALLIGLLLFGMVAQAANSSNEELLAKKKAIYTEVKQMLDSGKITVKEAQFIWQNRIKQLKKEEAK